MKNRFILFLLLLLVITAIFLVYYNRPTEQQQTHDFIIPSDYLKEAPDIPVFWISTYSRVTDFLEMTVKKGKVIVIGTSAGGRKIRAVFYGDPRQGTGTTTFSGSLGFGDVGAYRGPDQAATGASS